MFNSVSQSYSVTMPDLQNGHPKGEEYRQKESSVLSEKDATFSEKSTRNSEKCANPSSPSSWCGSISQNIVYSLENFFYR